MLASVGHLNAYGFVVLGQCLLNFLAIMDLATEVLVSFFFGSGKLERSPYGPQKGLLGGTDGRVLTKSHAEPSVRGHRHLFEGHRVSYSRSSKKTKKGSVRGGL